MRKSVKRVVAFVVARIATLVVGLLIGLAAGSGVVYLWHAKNWPGNPEPRHPAAFSEVSDEKAGELAKRFRPWLKFDSLEHWRPLNISHLFAEREDGAPAHQFCKRAGPKAACTPLENLADFKQQAEKKSALGSATYINLAGSEVDDYRGSTRCRELYDCGSGPGSAIYYHVTRSNDRFYVDYWWFLRFNHFYKSEPKVSCRTTFARKQGICDEHEGDWEGITVVTPPGDEDRIDYAVYAAHKGTFRYITTGFRHPPGQPTRPEVYVARGSHASYPTDCKEECNQPPTLAAKGLITLPESSYDGGQDWERNGEDCEPNARSSCLLALKTEHGSDGWADWPGLWGEGCGDACAGRMGPGSPRSPGVQARYQTPWCSTHDNVFTCDGKALACNDWLGPLVVAVACDPDRLAKGLTKPKEQEAGTFTVTVERRKQKQTKTKETTPGIVQVLGDPLEAGDNVTLAGNAQGVQILVRAQQDRRLTEARFHKLNLQQGREAVVTIEKGRGGSSVRLAGDPPAEFRVLELEPPTKKP